MMNEHIGDMKSKILPILKRYDVKRAALFGSYVRGDMRKDSDIDILVEFRGEKSLLDLISLKLDLEKELGREVDVLTYNALHPYLKETILEKQVAIL